jgi:hypothetical protein
MAYRPDLAVVDSSGWPVLSVEVKAIKDFTTDEAMEFRQNLLGDGLAFTPAYFMLLTPTEGYLWKQDSEPYRRPPDYTFSVQPVLDRYLSSEWSSPTRVREHVLESVFAAWLDHLIPGPSEPEAREELEPEGVLARSGLLEDLHGTRLVRGHNYWSSTSSPTSY